jgi:hypothetical protein
MHTFVDVLQHEAVVVGMRHPREFACIAPGQTLRLLGPLQARGDDWKRISGNYTRLSENVFALYRLNGVLWLRLGDHELRVTPHLRTKFSFEDDDRLAILVVQSESMQVEVREAVPEYLRGDPIADHMSYDDSVWTYCIHNALRDEHSRRIYWGCAGL